MGFGRFGGNSRNFGKSQGNAMEFSGFCMALDMNSVGILGGFPGNAGFSGNLGVWGGFGRFGVSKGFCAKSQDTCLRCHTRFEMDSQQPSSHVRKTFATSSHNVGQQLSHPAMPHVHVCKGSLAIKQRGRERKGPPKSPRNFVSETGRFGTSPPLTS